METHDPGTYEAILAADRQSRERFGGHGSALAQAYNHIILPLASPRDQRTQIRWGIADFRRRFRRDPEGMWLAETAVDTWTLEALAAEGIRFTILAAPRQCEARAPQARGGGWATCPAAAWIRPVPTWAPALGPLDRALFLRRARVAGGRLRGAAATAATPSRRAS